MKFGQILSTRRDLLPDDLAVELAKLQDRVPPFPGAQARAFIENGLGQSPQPLRLSYLGPMFRYEKMQRRYRLAKEHSHRFSPGFVARQKKALTREKDSLEAVFKAL